MLSGKEHSTKANWEMEKCRALYLGKDETLEIRQPYARLKHLQRKQVGRKIRGSGVTIFFYVTKKHQISKNISKQEQAFVVLLSELQPRLRQD